MRGRLSLRYLRTGDAMTIHYHGTPITPRRVLDTLAGRHFCVSYAAPADVAHVHKIGQSVMLDNGAFTAWTKKRAVDWNGFYEWSAPWLDCQTTWAAIPDVIDGDEGANDELIAQWPHGTRGAPVWHMHEDIRRLIRLAHKWPRVCIGSSGCYRTVGSEVWFSRMVEAMNALCGNGPPPCWLHMMRGMSQAGSIFPFASVDSTDVARNHNRPQNSAVAMATLWDAQQCPTRWVKRPELRPLMVVVPRLDGQILENFLK